MPNHLIYKHISKISTYANSKATERVQTTRTIFNHWRHLTSEDFWTILLWNRRTCFRRPDCSIQYGTNTNPNNWNLFDIKPLKYDINKAKESDKNQMHMDAFGFGGVNSALRLSRVFIHLINNTITNEHIKPIFFA
jgi:hypothetical protein